MAYINSTKDFLALLKQARIDQGLTQQELGDMVGMAQKKVAMLENQTATPRLDHLLVLASALDLTLTLTPRKKSHLDDKKSHKLKLTWE